jgi:hypothetical protein
MKPSAAPTSAPLWPPRGGEWPILGFTLVYLAAATVAAWATGNGEFVFYIVVMVLLLAAVWMLHRHVELTLATLWALSAWGLAHMAGGLLPVPASWPIQGDVRVLYSLWIVPEHFKYDQLVHAYGFGITTWVCWQGLRHAIAGLTGVDRAVVPPTLGLLTLCAAASMGFGALNEVVEFVATLLVPKTNVGGYLNTGWDLVANLVGAATAAVVIGLCSRRGAVTRDRPQ